MKKYLAIFFMVTGFISSCGHKKKNKVAEEKNKKNYFPIANYIQSEISYVDSLPIGITKYTTRENKTDTSYIKFPEFNKIAEEFICDEFKQEVFEKEFSETTFLDQTTNSATLTYSTKNPKLELQRVDVIANTNTTANNVTSIYLEKDKQRDDTVIQEKLLWRTRTSFEIIKSKRCRAQNPVTEQIKLVWGVE
ncbi:MAG TPA: hypothetical protein VMT76_05465 [Puia sp.]|nr:hypothetical protein [Puia sp.]